GWTPIDTDASSASDAPLCAGTQVQRSVSIGVHLWFFLFPEGRPARWPNRGRAPSGCLPFFPDGWCLVDPAKEGSGLGAVASSPRDDGHEVRRSACAPHVIEIHGSGLGPRVGALQERSNRFQRVFNDHHRGSFFHARTLTVLKRS